nr:hypothetical protein GCM10020063_028050 [Dactylosporangium thailandense]
MFVVNVPITVLVLALTSGALVCCPATGRRIHWTAQAALGVAVAAGTDAVIAVGATSWLHAGGAATVAVLAVAVFARLERTGRTPVLPRGLLAGPGIPAGLFVGAAVNFTLNGTLFVLPLLLQQDRHLGAAASGLALLPLTLPFVINPPLTSRLVSRFGPRRPVLSGLGLLAAGSAGLALATWSAAGYGWHAAALLVVGIGVSLVLPAVVAAVLSVAPAAVAGAGSGLLNAVRQLGATAGVAAMGALLHTNVRTGTGGALALAAVICATAAAWFGLGGRGRHRSRPENAKG